MTTTEPTTEEALWLFVGAMPECGHRRLYAADKQNVLKCLKN